MYSLVSVSDFSGKHQSIWNSISPHQETICGELRSLLSSFMVQLDFNESRNLWMPNRYNVTAQIFNNSVASFNFSLF